MVPGTFFGSISAVGGGKSQEGGPRRLYAETADHAQRHAEASDALGGRNGLSTLDSQDSC
mgnify:FL=1